jgi:predicted GTPase
MALEEKEKQRFQKRLEDSYKALSPSTCNILLLGNTGAGKSSLTNQVFGSEVTKSGVGRSITQKFVSFESKDHQLRIYDSKGIEIGNYKEFCEQLEYFLKQQETIHYQEHIHCVWILVDGAQSRVDTHWKQLCDTILKKYSILFIISKVDLLSPQEEKDLRNAIHSLEISNLEGVFSIISLDNQIPKVSHCEVCQSNRLLLDTVEKIVICQTCHVETPFEKYQQSNQMKSLIEKTIQILPKQQKISFIRSRKPI